MKKLLLIKQRYNFESNSQLKTLATETKNSCCLSSKDTILKAIHNQNGMLAGDDKVVAYQAKIQF